MNQNFEYHNFAMFILYKIKSTKKRDESSKLKK